MAQLQTYYSLLFGEPFPLKQYMSLYDNLEAKNMPAKPQPTPHPKTDPWQSTEGDKSCQNVALFQNKDCQCSVLSTFVLLCPLTAAQSPTRSFELEKQPDSGPNLLAGTNFPVPGAAASSTKETKKSKVTDAVQKTSNVRVFKDAYHAQLREVHGENMRAVEAMGEDDELTSKRRNRRMDPDYVNSVVKNAIREIAAEGELVTNIKVRWNKRTGFDLFSCLNSAHQVVFITHFIGSP